MIKPEELQVQNNEALKGQSKLLENHIDKRLREKYEGPGITVIIDVPTGYNKLVIDYTMNLYVNYWQVTYHVDQREGAYLKFTNIPPRNNNSGWKD